MRPSLGSNEEAADGRRHLALGLVVVSVVALVAYLSTVAVDGGGPLASRYLVRAALPAAGPLLRAGDGVLVAGQRAGVVRSVAPGPRVTLALDHGPVGRDAVLRART